MKIINRDPEALRLETYLQSLRSAIEDAEEKKRNAMNDLETCEVVSTKLATTQKELEAAKNELEMMVVTSSQLQMQHGILNAEIAQLRSKRDDLSNEVVQCNLEAAKAREQYDECEAKKNDLEALYKSVEEEKSRILALADTARAQFQEQKAQQEHVLVNLQNAIDAHTKQLQSIKDSIEVAKQDLEARKVAYAQEVAEEEKLVEETRRIVSGDVQVAKREVDEAKQAVREAKVELAAVKKEIEAARAAEVSRAHELEEQKSSLDEIARVLEQRKKDVDAWKHEALVEVAKMAKFKQVEIDKQLIDKITSV